MSEQAKNDEAALRMAISALSWAVGFIDGLGKGTDNYAARTLDQLSKPRMMVARPTPLADSENQVPANEGFLKR